VTGALLRAPPPTTTTNTSQIPKLLKPPEVDTNELRRRINDPEVRAGCGGPHTTAG
jgi:hypothetical protein